MAKKEPIYKGLAELSVQVEDRSLSSPDYFRITKMPVEFTAGVNSIKFKGNTSLFVNESVVEIEVLDSNGSAVYHEIGLDLESEQQNAVINVYINQDTAPGIGTVIICGIISKDVQGKVLNTSDINLRWSTPINIDISKRNNVDILYDTLPTVTISSTSATYTNLGFPGGARIVTQSVTAPAGHISYFNFNNEPLLSTGSRATFAFTSSAISSNVTITSNNLSNVSPALPSNLGTLTYTSSIKIYSGSGVAYLVEPMVFKSTRGIENYIVRSANVLAFTYEVEQSASLASSGTENSYNEAVAYFTNVTPQSGQVAKIRSYYKSTGVGEYIFSNETDITALASEEGFTPSTVTASFAIPTTHRNDRLDFKFEFVNPAGLVSKQVVETKNHLFLGGNTYVGGDDNLLTGSLYVAGSTGTGVHISGKGSAAMIRSIGYNGFLRATTTGPGGFVMYSGSIQPLLNASESYSGVGLELVANSESYFRYTTSGSGLLDIRTANFFLGNGANSISGSNGNISISGSAVSVNTPNFFLGNQTTFMSGSGGNIKISGSNVDILTSKFFLGNPNSFISGSGNNIRISGSNVTVSTPSFLFGNQSTFISGSNGNILISGSSVNIQTPAFLLGTSASYVSGSNGKVEIYSDKFIINRTGYVTASGMFVPKGLNDVIFPMLNTEQYYIDSPNIGRVVSATDETEYTYSTSSLFTIAYSVPTSNANYRVYTGNTFKSVKFQHLYNETKLAVAFNLRWILNSTGPGTILGRSIEATFKAKIWYQETGSTTLNISPAATGSYQSWTDSGFDFTIWSVKSIINVTTTSSPNREYIGIGKHMGTYTVPNSLYAKKLRLDFFFSGSIAAGNTTNTHVTSSFLISDIEVLSGGVHTFNLKRYTPEDIIYTSINAAPIFQPIDPPFPPGD